MKELLKKLAVVGSVTLLSACGGGSSGFDSVNIFDGTWGVSPECEDESYSFNGQTDLSSAKTLLTINGNNAVLNLTDYGSSSDCTGVNDNLIATMSLSYGDSVADASSICSNTLEVDATLISLEVNGDLLTDDELIQAIADAEAPSLASYGILCTSNDGNRIHGGDDENETKNGETASTRPTMIDDEEYLVRQ